MFDARVLLSGAAIALATAIPAHALTVTNSQVVSGSGELNNEDGLGFDWDSTPFGAYFEFSTDAVFNLTLARYGEDGVVATNERSGYTLDRLSSGGMSERLTLDTENCAAAGAPIGGSCNMISSTGDGAQPGDTLFSGLDAGDYRLGFYDSSEPEAGFAEFNVDEVAPVPLPAGGALLLAGLGGLGLARRKSRTA